MEQASRSYEPTAVFTTRAEVEPPDAPARVLDSAHHLLSPRPPEAAEGELGRSGSTVRRAARWRAMTEVPRGACSFSTPASTSKLPRRRCGRAAIEGSTDKMSWKLGWRAASTPACSTFRRSTRALSQGEGPVRRGQHPLQGHGESTRAGRHTSAHRLQKATDHTGSPTRTSARAASCGWRLQPDDVVESARRPARRPLKRCWARPHRAFGLGKRPGRTDGM